MRIIWCYRIEYDNTGGFYTSEIKTDLESYWDAFDKMNDRVKSLEISGFHVHNNIAFMDVVD